MIDLTPLDVRSKRGDFRKGMRGYDTQEVDVFLELVAERLEALVRENLNLKERVEELQQQVSSQTGREQAVHQALVTAQELRADMQSQAQREARLVVSEAETEARRRIADAETEARQKLRDAQRKLDQAHDALHELERRRIRFLKSFKQLLQREIDAVEMEEERPALDDRPVVVDLGVAEAEPPASVPQPPSEPGAGDAPTGEVAGQDDPPMDASVQELHAMYEARSAEAEAEPAASGDDAAAEELFLSLEDDPSKGS